jgi:hypothetical protein
MINEHDITKSMINRIRLIREDISQETTPKEREAETKPELEIQFLDGNGNLNQNIPENMRVYWEGTESEKRKFMSGVSPDVTFTQFSITPKSGMNEGDVKLSGILNKYGVGFIMNKRQDYGLTITTAPTNTTSLTDVKLNSDLINLLTKLNGYYDNWYKDWSEKLNTENFN